MKRLLSTIGILALIALGFGLGVFYMLTQREALVLNQDAVIASVDAQAVTSVLRTDAGNFLDISSSTIESDTLFIFYPGGLVRPQAYEWLGVALAPMGVRTLIPELPFDLAVISPNKASQLRELSWDNKPVVIGGHSLGGAMAARYALKNVNDLAGLVLMGAFSAESDDLSQLELSTLVLAAEQDGLATLEEVQDGLVRLPSPNMVVIEGAVHSFFGRYGPQANDGLPTVTRGQAEQDIIEALSGYFESLKN